MCRAFYSNFYSQVFRTFFMSTYYILFPLLLLLLLLLPFFQDYYFKDYLKGFRKWWLFSLLSSSSSFVALLCGNTQPNLFRGSNQHHILSILYQRSDLCSISSINEKKIFFSRLCQSPFLHPWPFFVFDYGRLTPLAFLLSSYHHLSTYYLREEKGVLLLRSSTLNHTSLYQECRNLVIFVYV